MRRSDLLPLQAAGYGDGRYLYAAQRLDGIFKIGRTKTPYIRMCLMFDQFRRAGNPMVGVFVVPTSRALSDAEADLVSLCASVGTCVSGREYFAGADWPSIRQMVRTAAADPADARRAA